MNLGAMAAAKESFRAAMVRADAPWVVEHVDLTCDHCEREPIVGDRYKCQVCEDFDLCGDCFNFAASIGAKPGALHEDGAHTFESVEGPERALRLIVRKSEPATDALEEYLRTFLPSESLCEHLAWLCVSVCPGDDAGRAREVAGGGKTCCAWHGSAGASAWDFGSGDDSGNDVREDSDDELDISRLGIEDRIDALLEAWEAIEESGAKVTPAQIDELAEMYQVVRGKWMCFPTTAQADAVWRQLATALVSGGLGAATEDKIAPSNPGSEEHAVCVYTDDYLDKDEVEDVRKRIRALLPDLRLLYKPDIYTVLGIYRGNRWGLNASILVDNPR